MFSPRRLLACALGALALSCSLASAQDLRIQTTVTDVSDPAAPQPVSTSLTLFHAGMVYDLMDEVGEVVIFEPQRDRFVILNKDFTAAEVSFSEINRFLDVARENLQNYLSELRQETSPQALHKSAAVQFQFHPQFAEVFDAREERLTLRADLLSYQVRTSPASTPELAEQYANYSDWFARLNYVLHPKNSFPAPRLKLNASLREHKRLPTLVELNLQSAPPVRLQAQHAYSLKLLPIDLSLMSYWESQLKSKTVNWMTFHQYQQHVLAKTSPTTARR